MLTAAISPGAGAETFETPRLNLYADSAGAFNLAIPGETQGLFEDGDGPGISPGQAGLVVYMPRLGGPVGVGQISEFQPISAPEVVDEFDGIRMIESEFEVTIPGFGGGGPEPLLYVLQSIEQSLGDPSVNVSYEIFNDSGDDLAIRPYLVGNLLLDPANTATGTWTPSPDPLLRIASTTTPRGLRIIPTTEEAANSVQVGSWSEVSFSAPYFGSSFPSLNTLPVTNPAFGMEWADWMGQPVGSGAPLADGESASVSATFEVVTGTPAPIPGETAVAKPVDGTVKVKVPGGGFQELGPDDEIPVGSVVDTRQGTVRLTSAGSGGSEQSANFKYGVFKFLQDGTSPLTTLKLAGPLAGCPRKSGKPKATRSNSLRSLRRGRGLWGSGKGKFSISGRRGSGSVRGTTWQVIDRCDGSTQIKSISGTVEARDFTRGKKFKRVLRSGQSYVARPRR